MSVTVHGQKQLVSAEPREVVDVFLELWLAASSAACGAVAGGVGVKGGGGQADVAADVSMCVRVCDDRETVAGVLVRDLGLVLSGRSVSAGSGALWVCPASR